MTAHDHNHRHNHNHLLGSIRTARHRRSGEDREAQRSVLAGLGMIGALGALVVTPTLLGLVLGRWLDSVVGDGVFWTAACIMAGVALGAWLVWQRIMNP